jgi:hypothetical protein
VTAKRSPRPYRVPKCLCTLGLSAHHKPGPGAAGLMCRMREKMREAPKLYSVGLQRLHQGQHLPV